MSDYGRVPGDAISPQSTVTDMMWELSTPGPDVAKIARYESRLLRLAPAQGQLIVTHTVHETGATFILIIERGQQIRIKPALPSYKLPREFPRLRIETEDDVTHSCVTVDGEVE